LAKRNVFKKLVSSLYIHFVMYTGTINL